MFYTLDVLTVLYECIGETYVVIKDEFTDEVVVEGQIKSFKFETEAEQKGTIDELLIDKKVATIRLENNTLVIHSV